MEYRLDSHWSQFSSHWLQPFVKSAVDFVYPRACCVCEAYDSLVASGQPVCRDCEAELIEQSTHVCVCCSAPVGAYVSTDHGCRHCRAVKLKFGPVIRLGIYRNLMQLACLRGKRNGGEPLIHGLARLLVRERPVQLAAVTADLVVPVPQHWSQRFRRTFNPAETVAQVIANELKAPTTPHILRKQRSTGTQKSLSVAERTINVRDAFVVDNPTAVEGQSVLLVDDIMTTGITANEITRVLLATGVKQVSLAVIARVLHD